MTHHGDLRGVNSLGRMCLIGFLTAALSLSKAWARPSLPPIELFSQPAETVASKPLSEPPASPAQAESPGDYDAFAAQPDENNRMMWTRGLVRAYEPTSIGYTFQEGDESFMDFTISMMVPLLHNVYPDRPVNERGGLGSASLDIYPYFAFTGRGGQYIGTRESSPVVGKQFNPVLSLRKWLTNMDDASKAMPDRYVELVYGHESNGQWISDGPTFLEVSKLHNSFNEARDEISRGWDYVGLNYSWRGNLWGESEERSQRLQLKLSHYLDDGIMQGMAEEYYLWERDGEGKSRDSVDGIEVRFDFSYFGQDESFTEQMWGLSGRGAVTWLTGIARPFDYHTIEVEAGAMLYGFPVELWYRNGYMTDLTDYYRKLESAGVRVSFWIF